MGIFSTFDSPRGIASPVDFLGKIQDSRIHWHTSYNIHLLSIHHIAKNTCILVCVLQAIPQLDIFSNVVQCDIFFKW